MQVSVETTSSIERRMTIAVPADKIAQEVQSRLQRTANTVKMNGFRPGKVPFGVVKKQFGTSVRQEVIGEMMRNSYIEALTQEKINPVGYPSFELKNMDEGQDLEFTAIFEVYPEIELADAGQLSITRQTAEVTDQDVEKMIDLLRKQQASYEDIDRASEMNDIIIADYKGTLDGEVFEGGTAQDAKITLGSGQMIPGFEEGLVGKKAGEQLEINVTFPVDYQSEALAGKDAVFDVVVKKVQKQVLPDLDKDFFTKYGVSSETEEEFRAEIIKNMNRELKQATANKVKQQIVDGLVEINSVEVPKALMEQEIQRLKEEAVQQYGGQLKAEDLPNEIFQPQAEKRVSIGLIFSEIVKANDMKVSDEEIDAKLSELSSTYEDPEKVIEWYKSQPDQKAQIESVIIEDKVIDLILKSAKVDEESVTYDEALNPTQAIQQELEEAQQ
jgi:trigger factor